MRTEANDLASIREGEGVSDNSGYIRRLANSSLVCEERAQGVIEFALMSMILLLLFAGVVDFSRFMYYQTTITNAARVGAEAAINPCTSRFVCGRKQLTSDDFVLQAASCESSSYVTLQPAISCTACITNLCSSGTPCSTTCTPCTQDICVTRSPSGQITDGQQVLVSVGYNFQPVTPIIGQIIGQFAHPQPCWSGDSTTHTLCATAVGRVF